PPQKGLGCFLGPAEPLIYPRVLMFSDSLHYCGPGQKRQEVWDANLIQFTIMAGTAQTYFHEETSEPWFAPACEKLRDDSFKTPPVCTSNVEIATVLREQAYHKWGYDVLAEEECPSLGAQYTRRACISLLCVANGILQPTWNHFARS
ncbi:hypothetical protein N8766_06230, partial [bacterium]|nr:hypothetical protein [bacterium]